MPLYVKVTCGLYAAHSNEKTSKNGAIIKMMHAISFRMKRFSQGFSQLLMAMLCLLASLNAASAPLSEDLQATHVLNRLGYGPRPGDIAAVRRMGIGNYIEQQLQPSSIPLPRALAQSLDSLAIERQSAGDTLAVFLSVRNDAKIGDPAEQQKRRATNKQNNEQTTQTRLVR